MLSVHLSTCRLCLTTENVNIDIFTYQFNYLSKMIQNCLPVTVTENDTLPKRICQPCHSRLLSFYQFRTQALKAQEHLMSLPAVSHKSYPHSSYSQQAHSRFLPAQTTYNQYVPEDSYSSEQREYEDISEPTENFCEVIETIHLPISDLAENRFIDPLLNNNICNEDCHIKTSNSSTSFRKNDISCMPPRKRAVNNAEDEAQIVKDELHNTPQKQNRNTAENAISPAKTEVLNSSRVRSNKNLSKDVSSPIVAKSNSLVKGSSLVVQNKHAVSKKDESLSDEDEKFSCDKCHFTTTSQSRYIMHSERHVRKYIVFCKECNISFLNKTEMTNHNIEKHDAPQFQCAHCNEVFTSKSTLYSHIKSHDPSSVHICEICGKTYKKKNSYKRHINRNHLGASAKAQCTICDRILSSKEHLRRHMLVHTDERNWVCATCGKCYRSKCYLTEHTRIHAGIKPYKCEICGKCFTQRGSLTIHKRSHTGERPFKCEYCHRGFIISTLLRYHMKKCSYAPSVENTIVRTESVSVITSNPTMKTG